MSAKLRYHLASTTGLLLGMTPIYALVELLVLGMDPLVSLRARLMVAAIAFLGLGFVFAALRERSKALFRIKDGATSNFAIATHDLLFLIAFNACLTPTLYVIAGASLDETLWGTAFALLMAVFNGPLNGLMIDLSCDLTSVKPSPRLPAAILSLGPGDKLVLFWAIISVSFAALALLYWTLLHG